MVSTVLAIDTGQKEHAQNLPKQSQVETRTRELGPLQATERAKVRAAAVDVNQVTPRRTAVQHSPLSLLKRNNMWSLRCNLLMP